MIRSTEEFRLVFKAARRSGTPLVAVRTADPASAMAQVAACVNGTSEQTPLLSWDFIGGLQGRNEAGKSAAAKVLGESVASLGPGEALAVAQRLAQDAILFFHNPQRVWEQVDVVQGIWNLRDVFKAGGQMLVLVTRAGATLPVELQNDVMLIDEPLPSMEDLARLVAETFESANLLSPEEATVAKAVDALVGLAAFPAEQVLAMSLSKNGLDLIARSIGSYSLGRYSRPDGAFYLHFLPAYGSFWTWCYIILPPSWRSARYRPRVSKGLGGPSLPPYASRSATLRFKAQGPRKDPGLAGLGSFENRNLGPYDQRR